MLHAHSVCLLLLQERIRKRLKNECRCQEASPQKKKVSLNNVTIFHRKRSEKKRKSKFVTWRSKELMRHRVLSSSTSWHKNPKKDLTKYVYYCSSARLRDVYWTLTANRLSSFRRSVPIELQFSISRTSYWGCDETQSVERKAIKNAKLTSGNSNDMSRLRTPKVISVERS